MEKPHDPELAFRERLHQASAEVDEWGQLSPLEQVDRYEALYGSLKSLADSFGRN